jgi:hypothetical protein
VTRKTEWSVLTLSAGVVLFGALKILTHYFSIWRWGSLDYIFGMAGIAAGLLLADSILRHRRFGMTGAGTAAGAVAVVAFKLVVDYWDPRDVVLSAFILASTALFFAETPFMASLRWRT